MSVDVSRARIRQAAHRDIPAVVRCLTAAFEEYRDRYTPEAFRDTVLTTQGAEQRMREMTILVAEDDSANVVGTIAYQVLGSGEGHVRGMAVDPLLHGKGIAARLLSRAEVELGKLGCSRVTLDTTRPLERAIRFYVREGYEPTGVVRDFFGMPLFEYAKGLSSVASDSMHFEVRRAGLADVHDIAAAHLDSIRSIGSQYYAAAIVAEWGARVNDALYVNAMARGEVFFIAIGELGDRRDVLGFSSHRRDGIEHRTAVYVRGQAARHGVGSALFQAAEADAIAAGAISIEVDASLAAVDFYRANGFEEIGRGEHRLSSGRPMPCVFMRKNLAGSSARHTDR